MPVDRIVLASDCPRRARWLASAGFEFDVIPADVEATLDVEETPDGHVRRIAMERALAVGQAADGRAVLGVETIVLVDGEMLGMPADAEDAARMLRKLEGREHDVISAVCMATGARTQTRLDRTRVQFAPMTGEEIQWYVASGEPMRRAGGYDVEGLASRYVTRIEGSFSNAAGLPVPVIYALLRPR